jgi:hypothetical protein
MNFGKKGKRQCPLIVLINHFNYGVIYAEACNCEEVILQTIVIE